MIKPRVSTIALATAALLATAGGGFAADDRLELMIEFSEAPTLEMVEDLKTGEEIFFGLRALQK